MLDCTLVGSEGSIKVNDHTTSEKAFRDTMKLRKGIVGGPLVD